MNSVAFKARAAVATLAAGGVLFATVGTGPAAATTPAAASSPASAPRSTIAPATAITTVTAPSAIQLAAAAKAPVRRLTKASLNLRTGPGRSYRVIKVIRKGKVVRLLGRSANGYVKVKASSRRGWVAKKYLARIGSSPKASAPIKLSRKSYPSAERRLTAKTIRVHRALRAAFPRIKTVYGYRPGSAGEHRLGRALDVMLPGNYRSASARALGKRIATWARSRAGSLKVMYVIWDQRIWNSQRSGDGWRRMSDGGSASANHKNHVHISVKR